MRKWIRLSAWMLAIVPHAALAAPVYLKCQLDQDAGKKPAWDVTLNEDEGMVTYSFPELGRAFTVRGVFTVNRVTFNGFTIDRTNLAFKRDLSSIQAPGRPPVIDVGKCTLVAIERAF